MAPTRSSGTVGPCAPPPRPRSKHSWRPRAQNARVCQAREHCLQGSSSSSVCRPPLRHRRGELLAPENPTWPCACGVPTRSPAGEAVGPRSAARCGAGASPHHHTVDNRERHSLFQGGRVFPRRTAKSYARWIKDDDVRRRAFDQPAAPPSRRCHPKRLRRDGAHLVHHRLEAHQLLLPAVYAEHTRESPVQSRVGHCIVWQAV
jgi:hypothetical protein